MGWLNPAQNPRLSGYASAVSPERIWKWGHRESGGHRSDGKKLVAPLHFFGSKGTISRFGERFRDGHYSLVSRPSLFALLL